MKALRAVRVSRCCWMYPCLISADGTFRYGPDGWEVTKVSPGLFEVTHNLDTLDYLPLPGVMSGVGYKENASINTMTENSFRVLVSDSTQPVDFDFLVMVWVP